MKKVFYLFLILSGGIFLLSSACGGDQKRGGIKPKTPPMDTVTVEPVKPVVNVYIENSGSMDGYVKGKTEFKGAIRDLLVLLKYRYDEDNIKVFFINNKIKDSDTKGDLAAFAQNIELTWRQGQDRKDWSSTNLNQIFKMILGKTDNSTISILFSDCIYSIHGSTDAVGLLNDEKSLTKDAFLSKWKNDKVPLATTIVKMNSKFDGKYYPYTGDDKKFNVKMERPYYICIMASQNYLTDFNKHIELKKDKIEGFENKYVLSSENPKNIYYSVLQATYNEGRFKSDRKVSSKDFIHGIEDVKLGRGVNKLSFAIAVDFSTIQAENDYLTNPNNYIVTTDNFDIKEIIPAEKNNIKSSDWNKIGKNNPTHIIKLEAKSKAVSDVAFALKKDMPKWIEESSTEDDTQTSKLKGTTFGLKYWVTGIAEAYQVIYPDNKNFFECSISIKK